MTDIAAMLFDAIPDVRYVATYRAGALALHQRPAIENASASESDRYEELIVNPTLLTLLAQRGNIDCGGLEYVVIRYGSFFELVQPLRDGHLSVGIEPHAEVMSVAAEIRRRVAEGIGASGNDAASSAASPV
jgi:hypothetical protein